MDGAQSVSLAIAFSAGLFSFVSPCVLPLIPSYVSYITGVSFEDLTAEETPAHIRALTIKNSLLFILGFSAIFVALGASSSFVGQLLLQHSDIIRKVGGVLIVFFGLYVMGLIKLNFLMRERKVHLHEKPAGLVGSFLVGVTFAAGWTPCVGPILGSILLYASTTHSVGKGLLLLTAYSLGLGIPFFLTSLAINSFLATFKRIHPYMRVISVVSGAFLVVVGVLLYTDYLSILSNYLVIWTGFGGI